MEYKFGLVILHYLSLEQTIKLLDCVIHSEFFSKLNIYLVDNASNNETGQILKENYTYKNIRVLLLNTNLGFAKGNNQGIEKALNDGCDFIICSNNDVEVDINKDFISRVINIFENDKNIAVIGPRIRDLQGGDQNPFIRIRPNYNRFLLNFVYKTKVGKLIFLVRHLYLNKYFGEGKKKIESFGKEYVYALHGSFLIFTPVYFRYFNGFDDSTFLYAEEDILGEQLCKNGLSMYYTDEIQILHKEDGATDELMKKNYKKKRLFYLENFYSSYGLFVDKYLKTNLD